MKNYHMDMGMYTIHEDVYVADDLLGKIPPWQTQEE